MSYHKYQTPGFVIASSESGESDKMLYILTKDFGLVRALAKSLRVEKSKLRYNSQNFSCGTFTLVRGKDVWRVVGAEGVEIFWMSIETDREKLLLITRLFQLIIRLVHGEAVDPYLFMVVRGCVKFFRENNTLSQDLSVGEAVCVSRILFTLGYFPNRPEYEKILAEADDFSDAVLATAKTAGHSIYTDINNALRSSHL